MAADDAPPPKPIPPRTLGPELARWREAGWLDAAGAEAILADAEAREAARAGPAVASNLLVILGAVLLCLAAAAFVAANWAAMPRIVKFALCVVLIWIAFAAAAFARQRRAPGLAHGFALIASSLFGSGVMLTSQMYHSSGVLSDLFLIWGFGALATGALLRSPPSLVLAAGLFIAWDVWNASHYSPFGTLKPLSAQLLFLPVWALLSAALWRSGWRGGFHIAALGLLYWVIQFGARTLELSAGDFDRLVYLPCALVGLLVFGLGLAGDRLPALIPRFEALRPGLGRALAVYGFLAMMTGLLVVAAFHSAFSAGDALLLLVPCTLTLWAAAQGGRRTLVVWSAVWLAIALATIYIATVGTLLETSMFFLFAAIGVGAVAWVAWKLDQNRDRPEPPGARPGAPPKPTEPTTVAEGAGS